MANEFLSGSVAIPADATEVTVTGLALSFTPSAVLPTVRAPSTDSDIISAHIASPLTTDGFTVALSSPAPTTGYRLDYVVFAEGGISPVAGDTLAVSYGELKTAVAAFLGYDAANLTTAQTSEVDAHIQSGIRNFYYPPKLEGVDENFEWSFIRQNGTVTAAAGVGDYVLPNGTGRILGQIALVGEDGPMIPVIPYGEIVQMRSRPRTERPRFAAVMSGTAYGSRGQLKQLMLYPTPERAYTLSFVCDADTGKLNATTRQFPLGGAMFSELVIESCLAVAEQRSNDAEDLHTRMFNRLLVAMIARDRKSSAQNFGDIGDPEAREYSDFRPLPTRGLLI